MNIYAIMAGIAFGFIQAMILAAYESGREGERDPNCNIRILFYSIVITVIVTLIAQLTFPSAKSLDS